MLPLTRSMGLVLEEFYNTMRTVGVSAATGEGIGDLLEAIGEAKQEYFDVFLESIRAAKAAKAKEEAKKQEKVMKNVKGDLDPEDTVRGGVAGEGIVSDDDDDEDDDDNDDEDDNNDNNDVTVGEETKEERAERKEFEKLVEWADQLKKEHADQSLCRVCNKQVNPACPSPRDWPWG